MHHFEGSDFLREGRRLHLPVQIHTAAGGGDHFTFRTETRSTRKTYYVIHAPRT